MCGKRAALAAVVGLVALVGCSKDQAGTVTGRVLLDNKPAGGAAITFLGADGRTATALTDDTGAYRAEGVPVGPAVVGVSSLPDAGGDTADAGMVRKNQAEADPQARAKQTDEAAKRKKGPKIPERYGDPGASGLKHTVTEGTTTYDIPLTK